jgi:uncharacterized protein YukE
VATPAALRRSAAELSRQAEVVTTALDRVRGGVTPEVWRGPAADRFAAELATQRARLHAAADDLRRTAVTLHARADHIEAQRRAGGPPA